MLVEGTGLPDAPQPRDDLAYVDPELRPFAANIQAAFAAFPKLSRESLTASREAWTAFDRLPGECPGFEKRVISGAPTGPPVTIYLINIAVGARRPIIVHMHGGGFISGTALGAVAELQLIATQLDCAIVTVDYRIAPETTFAGSLEDNYTALRWVFHNADGIGIDPERIAILGESAGGGHAALLALAARDRGEVPICFQALTYPMLDDRTGSSRTPPWPAGTIMWTAQENRFGWRSLLGHEPGGSNVPAAGVPARYADLSSLPPTFIAVGSLDLFIDEDIDYARRLIHAGVPTELLVVPGAFHGFDVLAPETDVAVRFSNAKLDALRRAFYK